MLLFSTLVRSLKQKTRILLHFYSGITDCRQLPGYVYRNSTFKIELLQHLDCVENICDRMIKTTMHSNDNYFISSLLTKTRQLLLNCLNLIIGSQLGKCLQQKHVSYLTVDHVLHVCLTSFHVSTHVSQHGGLTGTLKLLSSVGRNSDQSQTSILSSNQSEDRREDVSKILRLLGCLCCNNESAVTELVTRFPGTVDTLVTIMRDITRHEVERREAVGVLAQITSSSNISELLPVITGHTDKIYTGIIGTTKCNFNRVKLYDNI